MSAAAASSSSSSAAAPSKADRLRALAARKEAEQKAADAKAQYEASMEEINEGMKGLAAASTLEKSLDRALDLAADVDAFDRIAMMMKDRHPEKDELMYKLEDQLSEEFWVHGVLEPVDPKKDDDKKWKAKCEEWKKAFLELETKFIRSAVLANDLKCVFEAQRAARKAAVKSASVSKDAAKVSEKKATDAIAVSAKTIAAAESILSVADKPCKCGTQCENRACGCKKAGKSCSSKCNCKRVGCCNPSSYPETDAGELECASAIAKYTKALRAKAHVALAESERRKANIEDILAHRAESGID